MFSQLKPYLKEGKRRIKNRRSRERQEDKANRAEKQMSLKDATWVVLEDAWRHTTGNGRLPVGSRRLFYAVRSRIPEVTDKRFATDTGYQYFSQTLLPEYQKQRVGPVRSLWLMSTTTHGGRCTSRTPARLWISVRGT